MKPVLVVLALIGILFVVILFVSGSNAENDAPANPDGRRELARTYRPPGLVSGVGSLLGRWSRKVEFAQTAYTVTGDPIEVQVPGADDSFRRATIRVAPPNCASAKIEYEATDAEGADLQLDRQTWQGSEDDPCVGSIVVRPKGGTLRIACAPAQTCSITFE